MKIAKIDKPSFTAGYHYALEVVSEYMKGLMDFNEQNPEATKDEYNAFTNACLDNRIATVLDKYITGNEVDA